MTLRDVCIFSPFFVHYDYRYAETKEPHDFVTLCVFYIPNVYNNDALLLSAIKEIIVGP